MAFLFWLYVAGRVLPALGHHRDARIGKGGQHILSAWKWWSELARLQAPPYLFVLFGYWALTPILNDES